MGSIRGLGILIQTISFIQCIVMFATVYPSETMRRDSSVSIAARKMHD